MKKSEFAQVSGTFRQLNICSNQLFDGGQLMQMEDELPIVIARGPNSEPLLWLDGIANKAGNKLINVISASVAVHPLFRVDRARRELTAFIGPQKIIHISSSKETATVDFLDLGLLGFSITGDRKKLLAGGIEMSDNKFYGTAAMLNLDPRPKTSLMEKEADV